MRQVTGGRQPAVVKHRSNSTRQPGEAYTAKEELKVLKLLVQVVGRHFLFLGLSIAMGDQSAGVQSWGGASLCLALCIQMCSDVYIYRYYVAFGSLFSRLLRTHLEKKRVRPLRLPATWYNLLRPFPFGAVFGRLRST